MKKGKMKWFILPLALVLVLGIFAVGAFAVGSNPKVTCDCTNIEKPQFNITNANPFAALDTKHPDLFGDSFKGVMPGDKVSQDIDFELIGNKGTVINVYLRAEDPTFTNKDSLSEEQAYENYNKILETAGVTYTVTQDGKNITKEMEVGDKGVLIGTYSAPVKHKLNVTLNIPVTAGNELQDLTGAVDWVFYADSTPLLNKEDHYAYIIGYPNGKVGPNDKITRAEVATIFFRLMDDKTRDGYWKTTNKFSDVKKGQWFNNAISTLCNAGILAGRPDGTFRPTDPITRAELAVIAARFDSFLDQPVTSKTFPDIKGHWAQKDIERAAGRGWVTGRGDGKFYPNDQITRAEAMALINRVLERGVDKPGLCKGYKDWPDNVKGAWYYYDVLEATNSHYWERSGRPLPNVFFNAENWTKMRQTRDWTELEH